LSVEQVKVNINRSLISEVFSRVFMFVQKPVAELFQCCSSVRNTPTSISGFLIDVVVMATNLIGPPYE